MTVNEVCQHILQQPCPYTNPPLMYLNGHQFCPCISEAIRQAYIGGYRAGKAGEEPEVGVAAIEGKDDTSAT